MDKKILVIDDDEKLNQLLKNYLKKYGFDVFSVTVPKEGLRLLKKKDPDLVILDIMLPDMDGFEVCRIIRRESDVPVIMLTARGEVTDRIVGLEIGADDYLPKPFEPRELVARIQTILRRGKKSSRREVRTFAHLSVDVLSRRVMLGDRQVELTSAEFEILNIFTRRPGVVFSRNQILEKLWEIEWDLNNRSVDVLVSRLRQKLGDDPKHPRFIKTVWGTGYMFMGEN